jgi:hypothetical protein
MIRAILQKLDQMPHIIPALAVLEALIKSFNHGQAMGIS